MGAGGAHHAQSPTNHSSQKKKLETLAVLITSARAGNVKIGSTVSTIIAGSLTTTLHATVEDPLDAGFQERLLGTLHTYNSNVQRLHVTTAFRSSIKTAATRQSRGQKSQSGSDWVYCRHRHQAPSERCLFLTPHTRTFKQEHGLRSWSGEGRGSYLRGGSHGRGGAVGWSLMTRNENVTD